MGEAAEDRLAAPIRAGFEEHIAACVPCGTYFGQLILTRKALRKLPDNGGPSPRRKELIERFRERFTRSQH
jgi:hypothetical protein